MTLCDFERTGIATTFEAVRRMAEDLGVSILSSELVGLAPEAAFESVDPRSLQLEGFNSQKILENRLAAVCP